MLCMDMVSLTYTLLWSISSPFYREGKLRLQRPRHLSKFTCLDWNSTVEELRLEPDLSLKSVLFLLCALPTKCLVTSCCIFLKIKPERLVGKARIREWEKEVNVGAVAFWPESYIYYNVWSCGQAIRGWAVR